MPTDSRPAVPEVVLHAEQLQVGAHRVPVERVVLRRRIVSEVRQVPVTVRREELVVERGPATDGDAAATGGPPLVIVLSREVPVVTVRTEPYEQVTVHVDTVTGERQVEATLRREQVEVDDPQRS